MRSLVRFIASVLAVSGVLLLADAIVTLAWQEPLSALLAARQQAKLEREFEARASATLRERRASPASVRRLAQAERRAVQRGTAVGVIDMPTLGRRYTIVHGTDTATLRKGPGHYPDTPLPGEGGTVAIAGHRTTYGAPFRTIDRLRPGQPVTVRTVYGRFTYRVERTRIVRPDALWVKRRVRYERMILTACHPLYSAAKRIVVFARLTRSEAIRTPAVAG